MAKVQSTDSIQLRSEEVQEILTRVPHWMIRWGSVVVFTIVFLMFFVSWFIKYPDIVSAPIIITTNTPPEKIIAKSSGRLAAILVENKTIVTENSPIAIIENTANFRDVFRLSETISKFENNIQNFPFQDFQNAQFGDIENAFAVFQKECIAEQLNSKLKPYNIESTAQGYEFIQIKERLNLLESQKSINLQEIELQKIDLNRYEGLFKKGIIAAQELEKHKLAYLQTERNYKSLLSNISQLKSSLNELNRSKKTTHINENKENTNLQRGVFQAFFALKKALKDWDMNYVLRSSVIGQVSFLQLWSVNQTVTAGDNVFAIIPNIGNGFVGKLKAAAQNAGKITVGQKVNIRLANFPDHEFGILNGVVQNISLTPDKDSNLLINVSLPNGLQTSYKKQIAFQQEMSGTADIITQDLRLIERLLYQFRDVFKR
jgi:multidrug resistance efflux pump